MFLFYYLFAIKLITYEEEEISEYFILLILYMCA